jgi:hypothetical protein
MANTPTIASGKERNMKNTKNPVTEFEELLQGIYRSMDETIAGFGPENMEVAEAFLRISRTIFRINATKDSEVSTNFQALADGGRAVFSPLVLDGYIFGDPSLTEERLSQIETAFAFAMPTWSQTDPEAANAAVTTLHALARHLADVGDSAKWEAMSRRLLDMFRTRLGPNHQTVALVLGDMGSRYAALGRFDEANACLKEALTICDSDPDLRTTVAPRFLSDSASIAIRRGEFVMARMFIDQAAELLEQAPTKNKLLHLSILIDSATILQKIGDVGGFAQVSLQAEMVANEVWESDPCGAVAFTIMLIHCNQALGREEDAERLIRWLAGKVRDLAREAGVDVLDHLMERVRRAYGSKGLPGNLEEVLARIKAEQQSLTLS